jgi:hypothetical protein
MRALLLFFTAVALNASAANPEDVLVYRFARSISWLQHEASPDYAGTYKGRAVVAGSVKENAYWIIDRGNNLLTEMKFYKTTTDGGTAKIYEVTSWSIAPLDLDPAGYSSDASGNTDQFMDTMVLPTASAVDIETWRDAYSFPKLSDSGYVWDLIGKTTVITGLSKVTPSLTGLYKSTLLSLTQDNSGLTFFRSRADAGTQSATLDTKLTGTVRNTPFTPAQTKNTVANAIATVAALLEKLGYDFFDPNA